MGDVIRVSAAVEEIFKDAQDALNNAVAKGGTIKERAEQDLGPVVAMVEATEAELKAARDMLRPLRAEATAENDRADATLNRIYDDTWNDVGRPGNDRYLALMYPGGAGYYTDGDTPGQPARMELLAKLYDRRIHPKLTEEQSSAFAVRVREAALALKADVDAAATPAANVALLERVRTALGRVAQFELANLKRSYKNQGMNEAAIHEVIPERCPPSGGERRSLTRSGQRAWRGRRAPFADSRGQVTPLATRARERARPPAATVTEVCSPGSRSSVGDNRGDLLLCCGDERVSARRLSLGGLGHTQQQ